MKFSQSDALLFLGINHSERVKTKLDFETKDSMSYEQEKGMSLGNEKDLEVERIQEKEGDNEGKDIRMDQKMFHIQLKIISTSTN